MYLEGILNEGGSIILDELTFYVPFELSTYLYLDQKSNSNLHFQFYEDYYFGEDVTYHAKIYYGHMLVDESEMIKGLSEMSHDGLSINFTDLKKDTTYKIIVQATYIEKVEHIIKNNLEEIRSKIPKIKEGPFYYGIDQLADSAVVCRIVAKTEEQNRHSVRRALNKEVKLVFDKYRINIPFPQVTVHQELAQKLKEWSYFTN